MALPTIKATLSTSALQASYGLSAAVQSGAAGSFAGKAYAARAATVWDAMRLSKEEVQAFDKIPIEQFLPYIWDTTKRVWRPRVKGQDPARRPQAPFMHFRSGNKEVWTMHPELQRLEYAREENGATSFVWVIPPKNGRPGFSYRDHTLGAGVVAAELNNYHDTITRISTSAPPQGVTQEQLNTFVKSAESGHAPYAGFKNSVDDTIWVRSYEKEDAGGDGMREVIRIERENDYKARLKAEAQQKKKKLSPWLSIGLDIFTLGTWDLVIKDVLVKVGKWLWEGLVWLFEKLKELWGFMCKALSTPEGQQLATVGALGFGVPPEIAQPGTQALRDVWCALSGVHPQPPAVNFDGTRNANNFWLILGGVAVAGGLLYLITKEK